MKTSNKSICCAPFIYLLASPIYLSAQASNSRQNVFQQANNAVNKVSTVIAVFQPYLLKARQIYFDARQLGSDVKTASRATFGKNGNANNTATIYNPPQPSGYIDSSNANNQAAAYNNGQSQVVSNGYNNGQTNSINGSVPPASVYSTNTAQTYLPAQSLPINNPASVNNDGTGNWGNQNNGLYGNGLDALTGTVMGMGEAADKPTSVDLLFFAPDDGQNSYYIMTPDFARNNNSAGYMTGQASEQLKQWTNVNETEVALTKLTVGQFDQIQNNNQINNAVRNAQDYAGYYASVGQKLDGQVLAVKAEMDNRKVYALVAIVKQIGTSGSNGYLKIKIKAQGVDTNGTGQVNASAYIR